MPSTTPFPPCALPADLPELFASQLYNVPREWVRYMITDDLTFADFAADPSQQRTRTGAVVTDDLHEGWWGVILYWRETRRKMTKAARNGTGNY